MYVRSEAKKLEEIEANVKRVAWLGSVFQDELYYFKKYPIFHTYITEVALRKDWVLRALT